MFQKTFDEKRKPVVLYVGSFGRPPVQELVDLCHKLKIPLDYVDDEIQDIKSVCCGWFAVAMCCYLHDGMDIPELIDKLSNTYVHDWEELILNDKIVMDQVRGYLEQ